MPRGELLSLQWEQIDFIHSRIRILDAKTNSGERPILMNSVVSALLNDLAKKKSSNLVFPSNRKVPERFLDLKKGIKKAVQLASIAPIRFHDLRHTFATPLVQAGVYIITVQHLFGHAKIFITARYAHSPNNARIAAIRRLDELFSSQPAPKRPREYTHGGEDGGYKHQQVNTLGP